MGGFSNSKAGGGSAGSGDGRKLLREFDGVPSASPKKIALKGNRLQASTHNNVEPFFCNF
jgi:hypothetical protein